jgi:hypothetical protein
MGDSFFESTRAPAALLALAVMPLAGQTYRAPRAPGGKPDLNGI